MKEEEIKYNEIEDLDYCLELLEKRDKEIERLTAESTEWESKCYKYQDIMKEVRDKAIQMIANNSLEFMYRQAYKDILEILDKGE